MNSMFRRNLLAAALGMIAATVPGIVHAQISSGIDPCPLSNPIVACTGDAFDVYLANLLSRGVKTAFVGFLFALLMLFGFKLILGADKESVVSEVRQAYANALIATIIAGGAFAFADTFAVPRTILKAAPTVNVIENGVIVAFKALLIAALIFNIFFQGVRLILHQDESQAEKAKKQFLYGMIGAAIVILADAVVAAFLDVNIGIVNTQAVGIANFLGAVFAALAFLAAVIAGLYLIISVDEQFKEKAKKILISSLVVFAVVIASLALIKVFVFADIGNP